MGYETVAAYLQTRLGIEFGETTPDGAFTLLPVSCLGACDRAPAMMIGPDLHGPLDEPTIDRLLDEYRRKDGA
jgi:NADH-quinone oxidoreductase subunit E